MSLYIGNLSARTRRDELERVFRRFGRCEVRLKDGYGFVVYNFAPQAEKAMKVLQGRIICGQQLNITWSNKQPRPVQRNGIGNRLFESRRRDFGNRKMPIDYRDYRSGTKLPDSDDVRHNSEDVVAEGIDHHQEVMIDDDFIGDENHGFRDVGSSVPDIVDNGRWGEQVDNLANDNGVDSNRLIDRYDPYQGYNRQDKDENHWMENSCGSGLRVSQGIVRREQDSDAVLNMPRDLKYRQTCFSCGVFGHKVRDCPKKHPSRGKFKSSDRRVDSLFNKTRGDEPARSRHRNDRTSKSGQLRTRQRNSPEIDGNERVGKRSKRETKFSKRNNSEKKSKRSASLSIHSVYTVSTSRSASKSSKSRARSSSVARSRSLSYTSRSISKSRSSKPVNPKSRSRSRSRSSSPTSLSLSVSPGRPAFSPGKAQLNHKQSIDHGKTLESRNIQADRANDNCSKNPVFSTDGNVISKSKVEDDLGMRTTPETDAITAVRSLPKVSGEDLSRTNLEAQPTARLDSVTPLNIVSGNSMSISLEEMCIALRHFGAELPEESEKHASLEAFFGSARLWPWEGIYYRRAKKGPVSVENYTRRVAQNREFGIVDKYIRSSSGWGEMYQENP